jgi:CPA2 family monovalent cation:H+ antiporter-2
VGAGAASLIGPLAGTFFKVAGFIGLMLLVGRRIIPAALHWVAHTGSRELFRLAVLAIALGVAFGAAFVFDVSFALGAFFAGMILGETQLSRRAAEETLPLRDAFAVLFFVSVGMLFDPAVVIEQPLPLLATVAIIMLGKSIAAYLIVRAFGHSGKTALTVAASLAQIGEFSFILAALGTELGMLPSAGRDLILAGAIISIFANPFIFSLIVSRSEEASAQVETPPPVEAAKGHVILIGYGRVGSIVARELANRDTPFVVIENETDMAGQAKTDGFNVLHGNALDPRTLEAAGIGEASTLLLAIPEGFEAGAIFQHVRQLRPDLRVIARAHSDAEVDHLQRLGVPEVIMGEREIAARMLSLTAAKRSVAALRPVT